MIAASLRRLAPEWHPEWPGLGSLPRIELPAIPLPELPAEERPQLLGMVLIAALFLALHLLGLLIRRRINTRTAARNEDRT